MSTYTNWAGSSDTKLENLINLDGLFRLRQSRSGTENIIYKKIECRKGNQEYPYEYPIMSGVLVEDRNF